MVFASPPGSPDVGAEEGFYGMMEELLAFECTS
jgi:hypothetical protein